MPEPPVETRLDSWKEIASYLGREVRTVQGWEKSEGLPVHRHQHGRQGSVYAFKPELDAWRESRKTAPEPPPPAATSRRMQIAAAVIVFAAVASAVLLLWKKPWAKADTGISSVVVLPFLDMSPQKDQEYFSDGLTEEIIDALSRVPNIRVVARTSAFAFKGANKDIREIGQQLNVNAVLEGSVRKSGDQLRVTAQLNRVSDGTHLWSSEYDRRLQDVFAVQREISQAIADQLRAGQIPAREATKDLEAYRLYQEGLYFFNQHQPPESYEKAIDRYQQAIAHDPNFALAYSGLADAYAYLAEMSVRAPREVMPKAKEAALKAVSLDDNSAEAHTSLATVKLDYDWDTEGAQRELRRAMELNPGSGYTHHWFAHSLEAQGRLPEAMKEMRAALDLDPLNVPIHWDIGAELIAAGRYDEAVRFSTAAADLFPKIALFPFLIVTANHLKGDVPAAHRAIEAMKTAMPESLNEPSVMAFLASGAAREGHPEEARKFLDQMDRAKEYVEPFWAIEAASALGDRVRLREWTRRAYEQRSAYFLYLSLFKYLYLDDPETAAIVAKAHG